MDTNSQTSKKKWCYMEEYKACSCTQVELFRKDLPGYCSLHGNDRRHVYRLPFTSDITLGYVRM